ncbi:MAG: TerB family tellurite resistance protein [Bacteroidaceae bacterium]|nr:TerB family tellurite resistance protein [Bacteroidaceae bacterium]
MGIIGWFTGAIGWMVGGPLGGLLGYILGSLFDTKVIENHGSTAGGYNFAGDTPGEPQRDTRSDRDNFIFSLLVLSSCVIKADGRIMHSEMEYVRRFFRQNFNDAAAAQANDILLQLFKAPVDLEGCGRQIAQHMDYAGRLQLLDYLAGIAKADGQVTADEVDVLRRAANAMGLNASEVDAMLNLGGQTLDAAYKVLEVDPACSDAELKRAYKRLVLNNHPDRVAALGDDIRLKAEEKLKQINEAYERVKKARGIN